MEQVKSRSYIYQIELNGNQTNDARIIASTFIDKGSKVLDVGSACGDFGQYLISDKDCTVYGMEYDPESIQVALAKNVFKKIHQVDLNTHQANDYPEYIGQFDCITLLDVLEHTMNPEKNMLQIKPYLKEGGHFVISLPNVSFGDVKISILNDDFEYTDVGILDRTHLRFFTYRTIAHFFTDLGFEILDCNVRVSDFTFPMKNLPRSTKSYISNNPHSFVFQYVLKLKSTYKTDDLLNKNLNKIDIKFAAIRKSLKQIRKYKLLNKILPVGSKRRVIVKSMYTKLKGCVR